MAVAGMDCPFLCVVHIKWAVTLHVHPADARVTVCVAAVQGNLRVRDSRGFPNARPYPRGQIVSPQQIGTHYEHWRGPIVDGYRDCLQRIVDVFRRILRGCKASQSMAANHCRSSPSRAHNALMTRQVNVTFLPSPPKWPVPYHGMAGGTHGSGRSRGGALSSASKPNPDEFPNRTGDTFTVGRPDSAFPGLSQKSDESMAAVVLDGDLSTRCGGGPPPPAAVLAGAMIAFLTQQLLLHLILARQDPHHGRELPEPGQKQWRRRQKVLLTIGPQSERSADDALHKLGSAPLNPAQEGVVTTRSGVRSASLGHVVQPPVNHETIPCVCGQRRPRDGDQTKDTDTDGAKTVFGFSHFPDARLSSDHNSSRPTPQSCQDIPYSPCPGVAV